MYCGSAASTSCTYLVILNTPPPHLTEVMNISDMIPDVTDVFDPISVDNDADWLAQWSQLLDKMPPTVHVPCESMRRCSHLHTSGFFSAWRHLLIAHSNRALIHLFLQGITRGFRIGFGPPYLTLKSSKKKT